MFTCFDHLFLILGFFKGVTLRHTQGTYQSGMLTSRPCLTKSDIFFPHKQWALGEGQTYKKAAYINYVPRSINYSILVMNKNMVHCKCSVLQME